MSHPWYNLPLDIQCRVLEYLSLNEIAAAVPLCPNIEPNLNALQARLARRHIVVTNRQRQPLLLEQYSPAFFSESDLEYVGPREAVDLLSCIPTDKCITLLYVVWHLYDVTDLLELVERLPRNGRFVVEIEFDPSVPHVYDLSMVVDQLHLCLGESLVGLAIRNFAGDLELDMHKLSSLEALLLINTNVTFTTLFDKNDNLQDLTLHPNCDGFTRNNPAELGQLLPRNLRKLRLGQAVVVHPSLDFDIPMNITDLSLFIVRDATLKFLPTIVESSQCLRESFVYQSGLAECSVHANYEHILWLLQKETQLTKVALTSIKNESGVWDLRKYELLRSIQISKSNIHLIDLPPQVVNLNLSDNNITDLVETVFCKLSPKLLTLDVSGNPAEWSQHDYAEFPKSLVDLRMANCNIGTSIDIFRFPTNLERLNLERNSLVLIDGVKLPNPSRPFTLELACNLLTDVHNIRFPKTTKKLMFCENKLRGLLDVSQDIFGEPTQIEWLLLSNNCIESLADVRLPHTLRIFEMDRCPLNSLENVLFPSSLEELILVGCDISSIKNVAFEEASRLVRIDLTHNRIDAESLSRLKLPPGIKLILLGANRIEALDVAYLTQFSDLRCFSIPSNRLRQVSLQVPENIRLLDFARNKIKDVELRFPPNINTRLGAVNLLRNMLSSMDPSMLGHGVNGTLHSNLIELDLSGNKLNAGFLEGFPSLLSCVFLNGLGITDRYGYDIGANILGHGYCMGKRIET